MYFVFIVVNEKLSFFHAQLDRMLEIIQNISVTLYVSLLYSSFFIFSLLRLCTEQLEDRTWIDHIDRVQHCPAGR